MLIFQATLNYGISKVISELLSVQSGNQLYKLPLPPNPRRRPFIDVFMHMKQAYQSIVVALQKGQKGKVISKPANQQIVEASDYLIVISTSAPQIVAH